MKTSLLLLNEGSGGGRAEKFETRKRLLAGEDWEQRTVELPTSLSFRLFSGFAGAMSTAVREDVDVVHTVSNPFHLHLFGLVLSFLSRLPWIAEFRDPLVTNPDVDQDSWRAKARKLVESVVVQTADRVAWLDMIQLPENYFPETYPSIPSERWVELPPVGYDAELFEGAASVEDDEFTITYAGSFYEGWIEPYSFLDGVAHYVETHGDDVHVQFYGGWGERHSEYVDELGLNDVVSYEGAVSHEEIVPVLKGSDLLLYVGGDDARNRRSISSKMWDYIGARSPVLAIAGPKFRVHEFVDSFRIGLTRTTDDVAGIAGAIREVKDGDFEYTPDEDVFSAYTRKENARTLASAMNELTE